MTKKRKYKKWSQQQYTHAAIWAIWAMAILGEGDKAVKYFKYLIPIEHSRTRETANKYKVEPYVVVADMYTAPNIVGRGGWTWYTGSSGWLNKIGIEAILGLNIENGIMKLKPCIDSNWREYSIRYRYKTSVYNIKIKNPNNKQTGIEILKLNGEIIENKQIKLIDNGKINEVEAIM